MLIHLISVLGTGTNVIPMCSVYQAPTYEPNFVMLACGFLPKMAYLSMLFMLEMGCTEGSAGQLKNK